MIHIQRLRYNLAAALTIVLICFNFATGAEPMSFSYQGNGGNCNDCAWLLASGVITKDTPKHFNIFLKSLEYLPKDFTPPIRINSPGGNLGPALELGRMFRKRKATVTVGSSSKIDGTSYQKEKGICISACAYAFLGAAHREVPNDDSLGFHQFFDPRVLKDFKANYFSGADRFRDQVITGTIVEYLNEMGIDIGLYTFASKAPPTKISFVSRGNAAKWSIDNSIDPLTSWRLEAYGNGLVAKFGAQISNREFWLYCRGEKTYLEVLLEYGPNYGNVGDMGVRFTDKGRLAYKSGDGKKLTIKVASKRLNEDKMRPSVAFLITGKNHRRIATFPSFVFESSLGFSRAEDHLFGSVIAFNIPGDKRLPAIALKNCI